MVIALAGFPHEELDPDGGDGQPAVTSLPAEYA